MHYLSSTNSDGTDDHCEQLGWKRLQEYNPNQRSWKFLSTLAEGDVMPEDSLPFEGEFEEEEYYYPSLPFAALFSCFKVFIVSYTNIAISRPGHTLLEVINVLHKFY